MKYRVIVYFNKKGKNLVEKSRQIIYLDCKFEDIESCLHEIVPPCLIDKFEVVTKLDLYDIEQKVVKIINEEYPDISYLGEILGMDYVNDQYKVYIYDFNTEMYFKLNTGKGKYFKQTYIIRHIEDEEEMKKAREKLVEVRKDKIRKIREQINETLSLNKLNSILKTIQS